ncbi:glycosyltransferase family 2 protein [Mobiluncus porci]|uniref:Glycosyltransferase family 2 protein n=1 Tax=Mobiluncus porci TaxID=2652278 RepID=A0A7K0K4R3_9ACTO|nr:glycosyltransferase family 2 protein [Mobiluncus porci]MST50060.1 glycosyltransferase family 2 protein [Mobiluncus porci]
MSQTDANPPRPVAGKSPRLLVIIPAWNEEATIGAVLNDVQSALPDADIVVVSDGSTDGTANIVRSTPEVELVDLSLNLGVGGAMRTGYRYALSHGYEYALQVDADGQHDPAFVPEMLAAATQADLVVGARFAGKGDYRARGPRRWAMGFLSVILSRVCHTKLTDATSGFKLVNIRGIELFAHNLPAEYLGDTVEALVLAAKAGLRVAQVPVVMRPRAGGEASHGPLSSAIYLIRALIALLIALSRRKGR